jgi:hypothetical protein
MKLCTLFKGKPYGLAYFQYENPIKKESSFEGLGIFVDGKLHMGPFTCFEGDGWGRSYSQMMNGRPAENHYYT